MGNESSKSSTSTKGIIAKTIGTSSTSSGNDNSLQRHLECAQKSRILQLRNSSLKVVPNAIIQTKDLLRNLDLSQNKITQIPAFIGDFTNLKLLHLDSNRLTYLPDELGLLKKLELLSASGNALTCLPDSLVGCCSLKTLNISTNQLDTFPRVICHLQQIELVDLSANRLRSLPDDTELWSTLNAIELILNQNQLSTLPTSLVGCRRLRVLRVQENCLGKSAFNATLLADSNLSLISYEGNLLQEKDFQQLPGYDQYQDRFTATKKKMF